MIKIKQIKILTLFFVLFLSFSCHAKTHRIISLVPSQTELIYELGFGRYVVGVTDYCNYPPETNDVIKIGSMDINLELIFSLNPTLIVDLNGMNKKYEDSFSSLKLNYQNFIIKDLSDIPLIALEISKALEDESKGNAFIERWNNKLSQLDFEGSQPPTKVYLEIWQTPIQSVGKKSFINQIIEQAHGYNVIQDNSQNPLVNSEIVISADPDIILLCYPQATIEQLKTRSGWNMISAVKNNQIYILNQDLFVRPGPRVIDGILLLNQIITSYKKPSN